MMNKLNFFGKFLFTYMGSKSFFSLGKMWKIERMVIAVFLIGWGTCVLAQTSSFLGIGTRWVILQTNNKDDSCPKKYLNYEVVKDTVVSGEQWWKVTDDDQHSWFWMCEDEEKDVWYANPQMTVKLLMYQFGEWSADKKFRYDTGKYFSTDSTKYYTSEEAYIYPYARVKLLDGKYYDCINITNTWETYKTYTIIRGIGSIGGFFDMHERIYHEGKRKLLQFYCKGELIYDTSEPENFTPLLTFGKSWYVLYYVYSGNPRTHEFIPKQTIIFKIGDKFVSYQGKEYYSLHVLWSEEEFPESGNMCGYLYEDAGKVYARSIVDNNVSEEFLLYDFTVEVGDTLKMHNSFFGEITEREMRVKEVDWIIVQGKVCKSIQFVVGEPPYEYSIGRWIQGIGTDQGLIQSLFEPHMGERYGFSHLTCCYEGENLLYCDNEFGDCYRTQAIDFVDVQDDLQIQKYGNEVIFTWDENISGKVSLEIYNPVGQKVSVASWIMDNKAVVRNLQKGLYLYRLENESNKRMSGTFYVNE